MKKLLYILPFLILFSCNVQKRKYQKGFYVSTNKTKAYTKKDNTVIRKKDPSPENLVLKPVSLPIENNNEIEASADKTLKPLKNNYLSLSLPAGDSCDVITLKNGEDIKVHVFEITPLDIKYKKCGFDDGPLYIVKKTDVFMVKYVNGTKDVFKEEPTNSNVQKTPATPANNYKAPKVIHPLVIVALVCSALGIFTVGIGFILGGIIAAIAISRIRQRPERYKGLILATVLKIIGIVIASIFLLILLLGTLA